MQKGPKAMKSDIVQKTRNKLNRACLTEEAEQGGVTPGDGGGDREKQTKWTKAKTLGWWLREEGARETEVLEMMPVSPA